jgi:hypothetical protein
MAEESSSKKSDNTVGQTGTGFAASEESHARKRTSGERFRFPEQDHDRQRYTPA